MSDPVDYSSKSKEGLLKDQIETDEAKNKDRLEGLERGVREDAKAGKSLEYVEASNRYGVDFEFKQPELQAILDKVKGDIAVKTEKTPTQVQEKPQIKLETGQTPVEKSPEVGPGQPQTPPTAQNKTKTDESFTQLQEKLRMEGELYYEKIVTIWALLTYGTKKHKIDDEMKTLYKESHQKLIRKVTEAYEKGGGSDQTLQELLKNVPIPAKFAQKTPESSTQVQGSTQSIAQTLPKVDVKALPKSDGKLQDPNLNTKSPPEDGSSFPADLGEALGEAFARTLRKERTPLDDFMDKEDRSIKPEDSVWFTLLFSKSTIRCLFKLQQRIRHDQVCCSCYAILSGHRRISRSEFRILDMLEPYLRNPNESVRLKILELAHQGRSISDICSILNEDYDSYHPFVSRVISDYCRRGVLTRRVD